MLHLAQGNFLRLAHVFKLASNQSHRHSFLTLGGSGTWLLARASVRPFTTYRWRWPLTRSTHLQRRYLPPGLRRPCACSGSDRTPSISIWISGNIDGRLRFGDSGNCARMKRHHLPFIRRFTPRTGTLNACRSMVYFCAVWRVQPRLPYALAWHQIFLIILAAPLGLVSMGGCSIANRLTQPGRRSAGRAAHLPSCHSTLAFLPVRRPRASRGVAIVPNFLPRLASGCTPLHAPVGGRTLSADQAAACGRGRPPLPAVAVNRRI